MTKKEKTNCCQEILSRHHYGESVLKGDFDFLMTIFEGHPNWQDKKGTGISEIKVQSTEYNNKCFCLYRLDGTSVDISYVAAIRGNPKPRKVITTTQKTENYGDDDIW